MKFANLNVEIKIIINKCSEAFLRNSLESKRELELASLKQLFVVVNLSITKVFNNLLISLPVSVLFIKSCAIKSLNF